jgi:hypothetical protein
VTQLYPAPYPPARATRQEARTFDTFSLLTDKLWADGLEVAGDAINGGSVSAGRPGFCADFALALAS